MRIVSGFDLEADQSVISDTEKKWRKNRQKSGAFGENIAFMNKKRSF